MQIFKLLYYCDVGSDWTFVDLRSRQVENRQPDCIFSTNAPSQKNGINYDRIEDKARGNLLLLLSLQKLWRRTEKCRKFDRY